MASVHFWGMPCNNKECDSHSSKVKKALRYRKTRRCVSSRKRSNDKVNPLRAELGYLDKQRENRKLDKVD